MFFSSAAVIAYAASLCSTVSTAALMPPLVNLNIRSPASASTRLTGSLTQPINSTEPTAPLPLLLGSNAAEWTHWPGPRDVISTPSGGYLSFPGERQYPNPYFSSTEAYALARELGALRAVVATHTGQSIILTRGAQGGSRAMQIRMAWTPHASRKTLTQAALASQQLTYQVGRGATASIPEANIGISERGNQIAILQWRLDGKRF